MDDSYPYQVLSIRVSDGTYQDHDFAANYAWMRGALDGGRITFGIVYIYVRPDWSDNADTVRSMIDAGGGLHPRVALMLDVESGGNPAGDGSSWINDLYWTLLTTRDLPRESSATPTPLTFPTCGGCVPTAYTSSGRATGRIRTFPGKWRTSTGYSPNLPQGAPHSATAT